MKTKRFISLQLIIVLMLGLALVCSTYSWSLRPSVKGGYLTTPMVLSYDSVINGSDCTGATYEGTVSASGEVIYGTEAITSVPSRGVTAKTVLYFRTAITNADDVATNTSLFINISYDNTLEGKYFVGASEPTVDRITYSAESTSGTTNTVKWIPVVAQYEVIPGGNDSVNAFIDWFIEFDGTGNFQIDSIVLANN